MTVAKLFGSLRNPRRDTTLTGVRLVAAVSAIIVGLSFIFGSTHWHTSPAFYYVNVLDFPYRWVCYGVWFIISGIFLGSNRTRPLGYLLGGIGYSAFTLLMWLATLTGHIGGLGLLAPCNLSTVAIFYWSALKISIYEQSYLDQNRRAR